jgi:hypothetical protein
VDANLLLGLLYAAVNGVRWKGQRLPWGFCTRLRDVSFRRARHREIARRRRT